MASFHLHYIIWNHFKTLNLNIWFFEYKNWLLQVQLISWKFSKNTNISTSHGLQAEVWWFESRIEIHSLHVNMSMPEVIG